MAFYNINFVLEQCKKKHSYIHLVKAGRNGTCFLTYYALNKKQNQIRKKDNLKVKCYCSTKLTYYSKNHPAGPVVFF